MANTSLQSAVRKILKMDFVSTQEELCQELEKVNIKSTQSTLSRLLRQMGVYRGLNGKGVIVYKLPGSQELPQLQNELEGLIADIVANETHILVLTIPGGAQIMARYLDHDLPSEALGTLAGNDTVLVFPKSIKRIQKCLEQVKNRLLKGAHFSVTNQ